MLILCYAVEQILACHSLYNDEGMSFMQNEKYISLSQMGPYPRSIIVMILSFFPLLGLGMGIAAFYFSWLSLADGSSFSFVLVLFVIQMSIASFCVALGWVFICSGLAQYRFETDGLYVKYPLREEFLVPWIDFQQVCICRAAYTTRGEPKANDVICCVKHGEKYNWRGRWKTDNPFKYRSVICIAYTPYLAEGILEKCPYDVPDLRNTLRYRL